MATQIKLRRDTAANWTSNNPTLASGEPGVETDTGILKIGNGTDAWDDLDGISGGSSAGGGMEIGTIFPYAGTVAPVGSFICDGSAISRTTYADLFAAIGTTWGVGDGSTTFNIPDLQGAFLRGTGSHGTETMADTNAFSGPAVGAFEDDQMQGHDHNVDWQSFNSAGAAGSLTTQIRHQGVAGSGIGAGATVTDETVADGTNGTPRTGDETRPFNAGVTYCIKATPATTSGDPLPTYSYSTGWVANSDWTNAEFTVAHGLNSPLSDLVVKFFISTDGTEANAFAVGITDTSFNSSLSRLYGITALAIDGNSFKLQTATDGLYQILDTGGFNTIDAESYYYKVKVYRPEVLATELSTTSYDTGWVDITGSVQSQEYAVNHNLGGSIHELITRIFIDKDGSLYDYSGGYNHRELATAPGSNQLFGISPIEVDTNRFDLYFGSDGIRVVADNGAGGTNAVDDSTTSAKYRVVVYKPELISSVTPAAVKSVSDDYTITGRTDSRIIQVTTGASDYTITLPSSTGLVAGDEFEVMKADSGAGEVTIASTDLIKNNVILGSEGDFLKVRWTGSQFNFVDYYAHGSNANGEWERRMFKQECRRSYASGALSLNTGNTIGSGNWWFYYSPANTAQTFARAFGSAPSVVAAASAALVAVQMVTTAGFNGNLYSYVNSTQDVHYTATGEW